MSRENLFDSAQKGYMGIEEIRKLRNKGIKSEIEIPIVERQAPTAN